MDRNGPDDTLHVNKVEARAGTRNKANRNMLVISLVLIVLAFVVVVASGFLSTDRSGADEVNADNKAVSATARP